ncbi:hypothetical protein FDF74_11260 [Clostridium niameyense]|uniref:Uncharacterized protein n=1 Tax=Clostridium niameyense TaxID=1622073 RepID=A0A6M0REA5_9CLOT|nr:hypothetical protein [Clostridium niameyense]NEZ47758.1 hypothetical protein [Clostridium niameyense]
MSINNITRNYGGYFNDLSMRNPETKNISSSKDSPRKTLEIKDQIDISTSRTNFSMTNSVGGITIDKGTAAHTTLYVDKASFNQIVNYTSNNPECQWEELGIDDEKRWVVVNGQRFECPLSKEEKEARKKLRKTLIEILTESEKEMEKRKSKSKKQEPIKLSIDGNNNINLNGDESLKSNNKVKNLQKNTKVMTMLKDIMKINGGQGINLYL